MVLKLIRIVSLELNNQHQEDQDAAGRVLRGQDKRLIVHPAAMRNQPGVTDPVE